MPDLHVTRVGYVVSRFPLTTETFILREFDRVSAVDRIDVSLFSLFASQDRVVHEEASRWVEQCHSGRALRGVVALTTWLAEAPGTTIRILVRIVLDYAPQPRNLARAMATACLAFDHARTMRALEVDHVHAHFATYPALTAWVIHRLTGIPYSVTPHAHDIYVTQSGLRTRLRAAMAVIAVSDYNWMFLQHFGAVPARLHRLSYGLDLRRYAFRGRTVPADGPVDVLCISSFKEYKGQEVLLRALVEGGAALQRLRVEFIGTGPLFERCKRLATEIGVADRCVFSGSRDQAYIRVRLDEAHGLIQPSLVQRNGDTEGLPNTLIEAAARGATLVGTRVTGVPELVRDGVTGYLAEPASPESLAEALGRLLAPGADVVALQKSARRAVEDRHDLDRLATGLGEVFTRAARRPYHLSDSSSASAGAVAPNEKH